MRRFILWLMVCFSPLAMADQYSELYKAAGWSTQVAHFQFALQNIQEQYQGSMPPIVYQMLVTSCNEQFDELAMNQRAETELRNSLARPKPALTFFNSTLGKKVVAAETAATNKESLQNNAQGIAAIELSKARRVLLQKLITVIPYEQGAVDVTMSLTNIATNTLENILPGMGLGGVVGQLAPTREQVQQQVGQELLNTAAYVYRSLSDSELKAFIKFADSAEGKVYYNSALNILVAGLNN